MADLLSQADEFSADDLVARARNRALLSLGLLAVLGLAVFFSRAGYYNALSGPFELSSAELVTATSLDDFGLRRIFVVEFDSLEDAGWVQVLRTEETFTRTVVRSAPEKYYLVGSVGDALLAVETSSSDEGPRSIVGQLHETPPRLHKLLEQTASGAPIPKYFLRETSVSEWPLIELLASVIAALALLAVFIRQVRRMMVLGRVATPDRTWSAHRGQQPDSSTSRRDL